MKTYYMIIILFCGFSELFGQTDTLSETMLKSEIITEEPEQELKRLLKVDLVPLIVFRPTIAFEQRIGKNFSSETSISYESSATFFFMSDLLIQEEHNVPTHPNGYSYRGYQMFKYYFNKNDKQIFGDKSQGLYGNYVSVYISAIFADSGDQLTYWSDPLPQENYYMSFIGYAYGYQFRIGKYCYIEPQVFTEFELITNYDGSPKINPGFKLKAGFSLASISSIWN